jgi:hypothetical protein
MHHHESIRHDDKAATQVNAFRDDLLEIMPG